MALPAFADPPVDLARVPGDELAAELRRRGWACAPPGVRRIAAAVRTGSDPTKANWAPWCWAALRGALERGPRPLGELAVACYGAPAGATADERRRDLEWKRAALGQVLLRCRRKGLVERTGMGWYALPGRDRGLRQGTIGDLVHLLGRPRGATVRGASTALNVPESRIHHWLCRLRRDAAVAARLQTSPAGVAGWGNAAKVYRLPPTVRRRRRGRGPGRQAPVLRELLGLLAAGPRELGDLTDALYGERSTAARVRASMLLGRAMLLGLVARVGRGRYAAANGTAA